MKIRESVMRGNLKSILKATLIGACLFLCSFSAYYILNKVLETSAYGPLASHPAFLLSLMAFITMLLYRPIDFVFTELFRHYVFRKRSYIHIMLMNLVDELELALDIQELSNLVVNTFGELLHLKTVALFVHNEENRDYRIASAYGWSVSDYRRARLKEDSSLIEHIQRQGSHVLVRSRFVKAVEWQEATWLARDFDLVQGNWIIPLVVKEKLAGFIAFSAGHPDRTFDESDFQFFRRFAAGISKKVYNALRFSVLQKVQEELQDTQSKLMQITKLTAIEQLATGLAHQIHNPLTIISGKAQVLLLQKDRVPLDDRVQDVLKTIVKQTKRAADITKKLLVFSQDSMVPKGGLNLDQIIEDALVLISYQASSANVEINKFVNSDIPVIIGNLQEMREVFFNLILNAVQSIGDEAGKVNIRMDYKEEDNVVEVQIQDTGCGVEEESVEKLFNPFFTTRHDALGLGLFVTKQIVHRMGGAIRVESRVGEGSLFIVLLPCPEPATMKPREKTVAES